LFHASLFELAHVLVRLDHVARIIINANHGIMPAAEKLRVVDCVADRGWFGAPTGD
jgi:hypothetical protein